MKSKTLEHEGFAKRANEKYPGKFYDGVLEVSDETLQELNETIKPDPPLTREDFINYGPQLWLLEPKCPECNSDLGGFLGTFSWVIEHGVGECCECGLLFRYYHYIRAGDSKTRLNGYALRGF